MTNRVIIKEIDKRRFYERFKFHLVEIKDDFESVLKKIKEFKYLFLVRIKGFIVLVSKKELDLEKLSFKGFCELSDYTIFSMALKALGAMEYGMDFKSNGLYYVVKVYKRKVVALKFNLFRGVLKFNTKTFTFSKKGKYKIYGQRIVPDENGDLTLKSDGKNQVDFMRFYVDKNFKNSKMYALYEISKRMKRVFPEIKWEFEKVGFQSLEITQHFKNKFSNALRETVLKEIDFVNIVNYTGEDISMLVNMFKKYGINYEVSEKIKRGYNITVTFSPKNYQEDDPYHRDECEECYIQNLIFENLKEFTDVIFEVLLKELIIKKEVKTKILILPEHIPDGKFSFFIKTRDEVFGVEIEKNRLNFDVKLNGNFLENGDFAVIKDKNVSVIKKTDMHLIFDLDVFEKVKKGNNLRRNEFKIKDKLSGFKYKDNLYAVGFIGSAPKILKNGFPVREIITIRGVKMHKEIFEMMREFYVRYKNLTVMPYAKKYIKEFYKI